jgi:hypothetical protein
MSAAGVAEVVAFAAAVAASGQEAAPAFAATAEEVSAAAARPFAAEATHRFAEARRYGVLPQAPGQALIRLFEEPEKFERHVGAILSGRPTALTVQTAARCAGM